MRSSIHGRFPALALAACCVLTSAAAADNCDQEEAQRLLANDGGAADFYGWSVDASGDVAIVGAFQADGATGTTGAAYVFRHDGTDWVFEQKLFAAGSTPNDQFGVSVAIDGDVAVAGASADLGFEGTAYVFRFDGVNWLEEKRLRANGGSTNDRFGQSVAIRGNRILVGAPGFSSSSGAAYAYHHNGNKWIEQPRITEGSPGSFREFGASVDIDDDVLAIGVPTGEGAAAASGTAYIYRWDGSNWLEEQEIFPADGATADFYGTVALDGDACVVGAPFADEAGLDSGSAYVFRFDGAAWNLEVELTAAGTQPGDWFGFSTAIEGNTVIAGAPGSTISRDRPGRAHAFRDTGSGWVERATLLSSAGHDGDLAGSGVATADDRMLVGASGDAELGADAGAALAYPTSQLTLGANLDTVVAGDTLTLTTCGGLPNALSMLVVVDVDGLSMFLTLARGRFDSKGEFDFGGTVPSGLGSLDVTFLGLGFYQAGKAGFSNPKLVEFR